MGHFTTVNIDVAGYSTQRFIAQPQWGPFRRIGSGMVWRTLRGGQRYIGHPTRKPKAGGIGMETTDSTASSIPDIPPWMLDHVAAIERNQALCRKQSTARR